MLDFLLDLLLDIVLSLLRPLRLLLCLLVSGFLAISQAYDFETFTVGHGIALLIAGYALGLYWEFRARG